jgi:hypothetical protein
MSGKGDFTGIFKLFKTARTARTRAGNLSGEFTSADAELKLDNTTWRFPNLHGDLQWTNDHFVVSHAECDFLGRPHAARLWPVAARIADGATATFNAEYRDVDLNRFTAPVRVDRARASGAHARAGVDGLAQQSSLQ